MEYLNEVLTLVAGLVGFPAFLAAAINVAKYFGLPDGSASMVSLLAHLAVYVGVGLAVAFGKVDLLPGLDVQLGAAAEVLLSVLALLSSLGITRKYHGLVRGIPFVGKSHSAG